jgi:pimeloyl-ACP methyl ester carboxylesterase
MESLLARLPELHLPVLLVRGMESELIHEDFVREFLDLAPDATHVDVGGAGHMVAGDRNDVFCAAILDFLSSRKAA